MLDHPTTKSKKSQPAVRKMSEVQKDGDLLVSWFSQGHRDLPWRHTRDPYRIWISEIMLQQTTSQAVIPFYEKFLKRFPRLQDLAKAPLEAVLEHWAGLGYYSRARNIHKAAQTLVANKGFPQVHTELLKLPGFGPYTARAVASFSFEEPVGVLDGNVIRALSRRYGLAVQWWSTAGRQQLQDLADALAQTQEQSSTVNQALMELGATVCTPQSPSCFLCPWSKNCVARAKGLETQLPLKKEKPAGVILSWQPQVLIKNKKIAFIKNDYAPFLKNSWILPGGLETLKTKPKEFDLKHFITRYEIYIRLTKASEKSLKDKEVLWLAPQEVRKNIPYSLIHKTLEKGSLST